MPGLAGFISGSAAIDGPATLQRMLQPALHETFYGSGQICETALGVGIAWTSASTQQQATAWSDDRSVFLAFAGEHFDGAESTSSAAKLVRAYEQKGESFISDLNGIFHGVLLDTARRKVMLFNDRYGLGRVYVHEGGEALWFAHEAKSLLNVVPDLRDIDLRSLAEFLTCGCVMQDRTLFRKISLLPAGSCWTWHSDGKIAKRQYSDFAEWEQAPKLGVEAFEEQLRECFPSVMPAYLSGSSKMAMSLTGGLDGRMIMAWAKRPAGSLPCYTFGSPLRESTDVRIAREIARACGQPHRVIGMDGGFFKEFIRLAEKSVQISDGTMDVTGAAELYVNRTAREIAPVRLTGNYGSEILRANVAFKPRVPSTALYTPDFIELCKTAAKTYEDERRGSLVGFVARKQLPWHHYGRLSVEQSQLQVRSPFIDNRLVKLAFQAGEAAAFGKEPSFSVIAAGRPELARIPTDRGLSHGHTSRLRPASLVQEFTFKAEYAYDYGMPPWLVKLDNVFRPFKLERLFLGRHKFCHFRSWYRNELGREIEDYLGAIQGRMPAIYNRGSVSRIAREHTAGHANYTDDITACLTVAMMQSTLLDRQAS